MCVFKCWDISRQICTSTDPLYASLVYYIDRISFQVKDNLVCGTTEAMLAVQLEAQTYGLTVEIIVQQSVLRVGEGRVMYVSVCVREEGSPVPCVPERLVRGRICVLCQSASLTQLQAVHNATVHTPHPVPPGVPGEPTCPTEK